MRKKLIREMGEGWWSTFPGIGLLVLIFGELSFGAQGGLQKPVFREKADAAILGAFRVLFFATHLS